MSKHESTASTEDHPIRPPLTPVGRDRWVSVDIPGADEAATFFVDSAGPMVLGPEESPDALALGLGDIPLGDRVSLEAQSARLPALRLQGETLVDAVRVALVRSRLSGRLYSVLRYRSTASRWDSVELDGCGACVRIRYRAGQRSPFAVVDHPSLRLSPGPHVSTRAIQERFTSHGGVTVHVEYRALLEPRAP